MAENRQKYPGILGLVSYSLMPKFRNSKFDLVEARFFMHENSLHASDLNSGGRLGTQGLSREFLFTNKNTSICFV